MASDGQTAVPALKTTRLAHRLYTLTVQRLRSNRTVHRLLFGYKPSLLVQGQLWDWTTLGLRSALKRYARPGASLLDMGTGPAAVLAIYAKKQLGCGEVWAVDHAPDLVRLAEITVCENNTDVTVRHGSLFSGIARKFDLIVFNAPYIASETGWRLGAFQSKADAGRWSGGDTGLATIEPFLERAAVHLMPGGRVLLGVNLFYVSPAALAHAVAAAGLRQICRDYNRVTMACVYVIDCS